MLANQMSMTLRETPRRPSAILSRLPGYIARAVVALLAIWSMQFTIDRDRGTVAAHDFRLCAPGTQAWADQFSDFCAYNNVTVHGDLLTRTFIISMPDGSKLRTSSASPVWVDNTVGAEHKTPETWLLMGIAVVATFLPLFVSATRSAVIRFAPAIGSGKPIAVPRRLQMLGLAVICAGATAYLYAPICEAFAIHRVEAGEELVRANPGGDNRTFLTKSRLGDLYLLGNGTFDYALKAAGFGCRFYTADGKPVSPGSAKPGGPTKRTALPVGYRTAGMCLWPQYDPARNGPGN